MTDTEKAALEKRIDELCQENEQLHAAQAYWELGNCPSCPNVVSLQEALEQNAKLREQTELLVTLLRNDCDIEASWDGLRRFWSIELTENGCLMRDRACKAEAENAKLRELVHGFAIYRHFDCQHCGYREQCEAHQTNCYKAYVDLIKRARQMGIEVNA